MKHGLMAEFEAAEPLLAATRRAWDEGYRAVDAFSPMPVEGLAEAVHAPPTRLPLVVLLGGLAGGAGGYALQYYLSVVEYPLNIGGRPLHSWPSFIIITFELAVLAAALSAVLGMFAMNGLPRPYHPVFNVPAFARASRDRFFLLIEARDPRFDPERTRLFMESLNASRVHDVDP
jgi:hypothetical protein